MSSWVPLTLALSPRWQVKEADGRRGYSTPLNSVHPLVLDQAPSHTVPHDVGELPTFERGNSVGFVYLFLIHMLNLFDSPG